jgi:predicted translin family RNA/ssDNA-binding protein
MPNPPYQYRDPTASPLDLTVLGKKLSESNKKQQAAFETSRSLQVAVNRASSALELQPLDNAIPQSLKDSVLQAVGTSPVDRKPRLANLNSRVEDYVRLLAYRHFLATGTLLSPTETAHVATDEEYLAGACMGLCHDLARYGLGRATARDVASVTAARNLIQALLEYLLKFDFRNGYLRRKYDGIKYALKSLETIMYELSVTGAESTVADSEEPETKRTKMGELIPVDELEAIRLRVEHRDELREKLIKRCRDGQKAAKQAIYALHRGDAEQSAKLIKKCEDCITQDLLPIVKEEPPLHTGSFSNVMEEYAEAKLFYAWLHGVDSEQPSETLSGIILKPEDFEITLESDEYLGGLCDLTGEIGRYAVQQGTSRDFEGVKRCLEANVAVQDAIQTMERFPGSIGKKMDQLRRSVEKIERMTYEMSLSEAAGGRKVNTEEIKPDQRNSDE